MSGSKRVEFRRSWAAVPVGMIAIYASSPIQRIIGLVEVKEIIIAAPTRLWTSCSMHGRGIPRKEFLSYFNGKRNGYGIVLGRTYAPNKPIDPKVVFDNFHAPQSFRYLSASEFSALDSEIQLQSGQ